MLQLLILTLLLAPPLPLCRVVATTQSDQLPGLYTVTVRVTNALTGGACGSAGYALVQFDGGRRYPVSAVSAGDPYVRSGIPWYWRLYWTASSGKRYPVPLLGMRSPFSTTP